MGKYIKKEERDQFIIPTIGEWIKRFEEKYPELKDTVRVKKNKSKLNKDLTNDDDSES